MTEPTTEQRLEELERKRPTLSIEKIVAAVIMLIVTSVCLWAGTTLNETTSTVVELKVGLEHMAETVSELKTELTRLRTDQRDIGLIMERMKEHDRRITNLEGGKP
jgi:cell division protein FtsL